MFEEPTGVKMLKKLLIVLAIMVVLASIGAASILYVLYSYGLVG